jgi:hypothetical protein
MAGLEEGYLARLRRRWQLKSNRQVLLVLLVFACTGCSVLFIKKPLFLLMGMEYYQGWLYTLIYLLLILPLYQFLLLFFGFLFGQFHFFWDYERKMFRRIFSRKSPDKPR